VLPSEDCSDLSVDERRCVYKRDVSAECECACRSLEGEARYDLVSNARGLNPDGLTLTADLKRYF
jgi:hypothetical protein